ncbi:anthocyanidin 3-O-glucosyltransferase 2-like [Impatiens glandulifera]|uniref:anthocyanidin 3-O-glucosyltransferase 2-like n=1 Tax=Impatiens glandulifera TaxID=253017 RepID=UPI001FB1655C|nr:anthocyanidin 3-O-glucosyltransferase 2-like [Impatiens glandulifera]
MAKLLVERDTRLTANVIVFNMPDAPPIDITSIKQSISTDRLHLIEIPTNEGDSKTPATSLTNFIRAQIPFVKDAIATHITGRSGSGRLIAFLFDMFCSSMIDVAEQDYGVPGYMFFPSNASLLGLFYHLLTLSDNGQDITDFDGSDAELAVPAYPIPFPAKVLPWIALDKNDGSVAWLDVVRNLRKAKGIVVNTFYDVEPEAIEAILNDEGSPPIYPVGPILNLSKSVGDKRDDIVQWLDQQPPSSVIFLCFGSMGSFEDAQVKQMAIAIERSGHRFLWSVRRPPTSSGGKPWLTSEYNELELEKVMPEGFFTRTAEIGKVIGWAPQVDVLGHKAVGGFVTHCGWNSTMESLWFGVPTASWPLYAEQQANAFRMIKVLDLAVEIKMDYRNNFSRSGEEIVVEAGIIENALRRLMDENSGENQDRRTRVKEMSEKSRKAVQEGGSSYLSLGRFIDDITNIPNLL